MSGREGDRESGSGFLPTEETLARFLTIFYDNLSKFDEKNRGLLSVPLFFVIFPIVVVGVLVAQVSSRVRVPVTEVLSASVGSSASDCCLSTLLAVR